MSISLVGKGVLSQTFIEGALAQEVHRLLSLDYCPETLSALSDGQGRTTRWIDVHVVGDRGASKTAYLLVRRLAAAGWIEERGRGSQKLWYLTERGRSALRIDRQSNEVNKEEEG